MSVDPAGRLGRVERVVDELLDARPQLLDRRRGVNAFDTSRRSRVWSGGSRLSMAWLAAPVAASP